MMRTGRRLALLALLAVATGAAACPKEDKYDTSGSAMINDFGAGYDCGTYGCTTGDVAAVFAQLGREYDALSAIHRARPTGPGLEPVDHFVERRLTEMGMLIERDRFHAWVQTRRALS
ncbi:MAG: hypothetical protein M3081_14135 [Gemmatimonadota bacterium]|nr:hypothetical protein [Gemmatimonadota bacterium]